MKNKRGWILIVEAIIAILILFGFLFITISRQTQSKEIPKEEYMYNLVNEFAQKTETNSEIRNFVLQDNKQSKQSIYGFLRSELDRINKQLSIDVNICSIRDKCESAPAALATKEVYVTEVIIASDSDNYNPKKLRISIWE